MIQRDLHQAKVSPSLPSFSLLIFLPLACLLWSVLVPVSWQRAAELEGAEKLQEMGSELHSWSDIISIWTSGANQAAELKQGKLRCLKGFHNKEKELAIRDTQMDKNAEKRGLRASASALANDSQKSCQPSPYVTSLLSLSLLPSLSLSRTHKTTVKCSLTQKCQGMRLHLAAVVYNALWSRLIRICDTSQLSLFCLLGIWIIKEQSLKGAFSFSISSVLYFSERHIFIFLLRQVHLKRARLEGFPIWVSLSRRGYVRNRGLIVSFYCTCVCIMANRCFFLYVLRVSAFSHVLLWYQTTKSANQPQICTKMKTDEKLWPLRQS